MIMVRRQTRINADKCEIQHFTKPGTSIIGCRDVVIQVTRGRFAPMSENRFFECRCCELRTIAACMLQSHSLPGNVEVGA